MSQLDRILGVAVGVAAVVVVYIAFITHEFIVAGRSGGAVGFTFLLTVILRPLFLLTAAVVFGVTYYGVTK